MQQLKIILLSGFFLFYCDQMVRALEIIQPEEGQRFEAGSTVRVVVKPKAGENWVGVGIGFESLSYNESMGAYVREFPLSKDFNLGDYDFKVEALSASKQVVELKRKIVILLPSGVKLANIDVYPNPVFLSKLPAGSDPRRINALESEKLLINGIYSDGARRSISSAVPGTTYTTSNESVVKVDPMGKLTAQGAGSATITVKNGIFTATTQVIVETKNK